MTIYHIHHIVPKYRGGSDDPSNLVKLTIEEHAQAHLDLYHQHGDERDLLAYKMLLGQITHAEARLARAKLPKTEEHKRKISEAVKGKRNGMYGKKLTDSHKEKISKANSIPKPHVSENMKKLHAEGKTHSFSREEQLRGVAASAKIPRRWYTDGKDNKLIYGDNPIPHGYRQGRTMMRSDKSGKFV